MFYILTFSYAVITVGPLLICLLVPGTISECGLALTYMSAFKSTKKKKKRKKKNKVKRKSKEEDNDEEEEDEEEEEEEETYRWRSHAALSRRLAELTREHFEGLFFEHCSSDTTSGSSSTSSSSPTSTTSTKQHHLNRHHQAAAAWLDQVDQLLVQSAADWPSVISLRNQLPAVEREQAQAIASLQRSLLTVQKTVLPLISAARHRHRRRSAVSSLSPLISSEEEEEEEEVELLERFEALLRGWCRRVKALKTLHV